MIMPTKKVSFFCGCCGTKVSTQKKAYFTELQYGHKSRVLRVGYICPKCTAITNISFLVKAESAHRFIKSMGIYTVGNVVLPVPQNKK
jgi:hypothetical protein